MYRLKHLGIHRSVSLLLARYNAEINIVGYFKGALSISIDGLSVQAEIYKLEKLWSGVSLARRTVCLPLV